ncbi:MAG: hypothetical protein FJX77_10665 [Armatimonadetes bacterium]|nr:hypothetical protein [Armatimonadota bacterium]
MLYLGLLGAGLFGLMVLAALGFLQGHHDGSQGHGSETLPAGHGHGSETLPAGHGFGHGHGHAGPGPAGPAHALPGLAGHTHGGSEPMLPGPPPHPVAAGAGPASHTHGAGDDAGQGDGDVPAPTGSAVVTGLIWLMPLLSPLNWFSWLFGAGLAGVAAAPTSPAALR